MGSSPFHNAHITSFRHGTYDTSPLLFYILCYTIFIILYLTHLTYAGVYVIRHDLHAFSVSIRCHIKFCYDPVYSDL